MGVAVRRETRMRAADSAACVAARRDEERRELIEGFRYLMAPRSERHQRLVANLIGNIDTRAERRGPALPDGSARDPILVAEILFPSTIVNDRGRKAAFFRSIGGNDDAWLKQPLGREAAH